MKRERIAPLNTGDMPPSLQAELEEEDMTNKEATNQTPREQVIEKVAGIIKERSRSMITDSHYDQLNDKQYHLHTSGMATAILTELESLGYVKKAEDQSLPKCERFEWYNENYEPGCGQQERGCDFSLMAKECPLLTPDKDGCVWVKVEKEKKKMEQDTLYSAITKDKNEARERHCTQCRKQIRQQVIEEIARLLHGEISKEKLAENLGMNFYELDELLMNVPAGSNSRR